LKYVLKRKYLFIACHLAVVLLLNSLFQLFSDFHSVNKNTMLQAAHLVWKVGPLTWKSRGMPK